MVLHSNSSRSPDSQCHPNSQVRTNRGCTYLLRKRLLNDRCGVLHRNHWEWTRISRNNPLFRSFFRTEILPLVSKSVTSFPTIGAHVAVALVHECCASDILISKRY